MAIVPLLAACGTVTQSAVPTPTRSIHPFSGSAVAIGTTPSVWSMDHARISNIPLGIYSHASSIQGAHYVARFPYKVSSDSPVVHGTLYLTSGDISGSSHPKSGTLWAVNPSTGHILWKQTVPNTAFAEPIIQGGRVYVGVGNIAFPKGTGSAHPTRGSGASGLWVFSTRTGKLLWRYRTSGADQAPVTLHQGVAYLASGNRMLYALSQASGKLLWEAPIHAYVSRSGPRIVGSMLYVGGAGPSRVDAFNIDTHALVWNTKFPNTQAGIDDTPLGYSQGILVTGGVAVHHDKVISPASPNHQAMLYGMSATSGRVLWKDQLARGTMSHLKASGTPSISQGVVYAGNALNGTVTAVSLKTGTVLWRYNAKAPVKKPPVVTSHGLYFANQDGTVFHLSLGGKLIAEKSVGTASNVRGPILVNKTLFTVLNTAHHGYLWAQPVSNLASKP